MRGLDGKVVVVAAGGTGDGASIGGATCRRLAAEGARVVVGDVDPDAARRTVELIEDGGGHAVAHQFDAADEGDIASLVERAMTEYGRLDGLHYNAMDMAVATGADGEHDLLTLPLDAWQRTLDVGLTGFVLAARAAIPHLVEGGGGSIVATSSSAVYGGEPVRLAYATAKTGMTAVVRHIASRWGRDGIRANAIAPGLVPSPARLAAADEERRAWMRTLFRLPRPGRADDIAAMAAFLLSDDGEWVTGQVISVDGGGTMRA